MLGSTKKQETVVVFPALEKNILPSARGTQGICGFDNQPIAAVHSLTTTHSEKTVDVNTVTWFHAGNLGNSRAGEVQMGTVGHKESQLPVGHS